MKNKKLFLLSLASISLLTSCGGASRIDTVLPFNSETLNLTFTVYTELDKDFKLNGHLDIKSNADIKHDLIFSYSHEDPYNSTNYSETTLYEFKKNTITANKNGDEYSPIEFQIDVDLETMFPKDNTKKEIYFVIHESDWLDETMLSCTCSKFTYSWNNDKVNLMSN